MKNLLLAVSLDQHDPKLLDLAFFLAKKFDAKLWVVHVAAPDPDFVGYDIGPTYLRDARAEELREEHRILQSFLKQAKDLFIDAEALLIQGPTVDTITIEIQKLQIDLLVIGHRPHSWLYSSLVGHTSVKLVDNLDIPIMIIPIPHEN